MPIHICVSLHPTYTEHGVYTYKVSTRYQIPYWKNLSSKIQSKLRQFIPRGGVSLLKLAEAWLRAIISAVQEANQVATMPVAPSCKALELIKKGRVEELRQILPTIPSFEVDGELGRHLVNPSGLQLLELLHTHGAVFQNMEAAILRYVENGGHDPQVIGKLCTLGASITFLRKRTQDNILGVLLDQCWMQKNIDVYKPAIECVVELDGKILNQQNRDGATVLVRVLTRKSKAMKFFSLLLNLGADPTIVDGYNRHAFHHLMQAVKPDFDLVMSKMTKEQVEKHKDLLFNLASGDCTHKSHREQTLRRKLEGLPMPRRKRRLDLSTQKDKRRKRS